MSRDPRVAARKARAAELRGRGYSRKRIADALGVSERTVTTYLRDPAVAARAAEVQADVEPDAVSVLRSLLSDSDKRVRLAAAVALVRMPGGADTVQRPEVVTLHVHRTADGDEELELVEGEG